MTDRIEFEIPNVHTLTEARQEARKVVRSFVGNSRKFTIDLTATPEEVAIGFDVTRQRLDRWTVHVEATVEQPAAP